MSPQVFLLSRLNTGEKLVGADDELFLLTLQHDGRFAGSKRGAPLYPIRLAVKLHLKTRAIFAQSLVISLRINLFHRLVHSISAQKA